jgi:hypothetical protein
MVLKGGGRGPTKLGVVPLRDGAGEVAAVGNGVTRFAVGDRIIGCFHPRWFGGPIKADCLTDRLGANLDAMLAEYAALNEDAAVAMPSHLSFEEAATLPCAAVTAWVALTGRRRVTAGDTVLTRLSSAAAPTAAVLYVDILDRHANRCADPREGTHHEPDQRAVAQARGRRRVDAVEQCARLGGIEHQRLPGRDDVARPARRMRRVDRHDLAVDQPIEQVAQRREPLLDGRRRRSLRANPGPNFKTHRRTVS